MLLQGRGDAALGPDRVEAIDEIAAFVDAGLGLAQLEDAAAAVESQGHERARRTEDGEVERDAGAERNDLLDVDAVDG